MPAGATYEPIATTTYNAQTTVTFNSFSGYTDLILIIVGTQSVGNSMWMRFNSDSGTNYSVTPIQGDGASASSSRSTNATQIGFQFGMNTSNPAMYRINLMNYAGSTNKTVLAEGAVDNNGSGIVGRFVSLWRNTAAITSITLSSNGGTITGTATLYGIKNSA